MVLPGSCCDHGNKPFHSIKDKDSWLAAISFSWRTVLYIAGDLLFAEIWNRHSCIRVCSCIHCVRFCIWLTANIFCQYLTELALLKEHIFVDTNGRVCFIFDIFHHFSDMSWNAVWSNDSFSFSLPSNPPWMMMYPGLFEGKFFTWFGVLILHDIYWAWSLTHPSWLKFSVHFCVCMKLEG